MYIKIASVSSLTVRTPVHGTAGSEFSHCGSASAVRIQYAVQPPPDEIAGLGRSLVFDRSKAKSRTNWKAMGLTNYRLAKTTAGANSALACRGLRNSIIIPATCIISRSVRAPRHPQDPIPTDAVERQVEQKDDQKHDPKWYAEEHQIDG